MVLQRFFRKRPLYVANSFLKSFCFQLPKGSVHNVEISQLGIQSCTCSYDVENNTNDMPYIMYGRPMGFCANITLCLLFITSWRAILLTPQRYRRLSTLGNIVSIFSDFGNLSPSPRIRINYTCYTDHVGRVIIQYAFREVAITTCSTWFLGNDERYISLANEGVPDSNPPRTVVSCDGLPIEHPVCWFPWISQS